MPWDPTTQKVEINVQDLRGMLRGPSNLVIPNNVAYLAENIDFSQGIAARRAGAVRLLGVTYSGNMAVTFNGTTANYITFPDTDAYDLQTKWAVAIQFKVAVTGSSEQFLISRDVTPTTAGAKTFAISRNGNDVFASTWVNGTRYALTISGSLIINKNCAALLLRDGAALSLYLDGGLEAGAIGSDTRSDLPATTVTQPGAAAIHVGQNYDGTTRSGPFVGTIGWIGVFQDYASLAQLQKYTTYQQYPDPKDPRCILWAGFGYSIEQSGTTVYDLSYLANHGTIAGSVGRTTKVTDIPLQKVQALFSFRNPVTGVLQNCALIGGTLYAADLRKT